MREGCDRNAAILTHVKLFEPRGASPHSGAGPGGAERVPSGLRRWPSAIEPPSQPPDLHRAGKLAGSDPKSRQRSAFVLAIKRSDPHIRRLIAASWTVIRNSQECQADKQRYSTAARIPPESDLYYQEDGETQLNPRLHRRG